MRGLGPDNHEIFVSAGSSLYKEWAVWIGVYQSGLGPAIDKTVHRDLTGAPQIIWLPTLRTKNEQLFEFFFKIFCISCPSIQNCPISLITTTCSYSFLSRILYSTIYSPSQPINAGLYRKHLCIWNAIERLYRGENSVLHVRLYCNAANDPGLYWFLRTVIVLTSALLVLILVMRACTIPYVNLFSLLWSWPCQSRLCRFCIPLVWILLNRDLLNTG